MKVVFRSVGLRCGSSEDGWPMARLVLRAVELVPWRRPRPCRLTQNAAEVSGVESGEQK
jgi:hypothetical protein